MPNYNAYNDQELVVLLKSGDRLAYTEVYERYKRRLYFFAFKRLGNREEVKDLIHEIFISLWINHEALNLKYSLTTYLHSSVKNKILDILAHKKVSTRYVESFNLYEESGQDFADYAIRHKELDAIIEKEVDALPNKMRQVFNLSRKSFYTRKQIAEELGLSEQTVKSHIYHALKILKVRLGSMLLLILIPYL